MRAVTKRRRRWSLRSGEHEEGCGVAQNTDDVGGTFDLFIDPLHRVPVLHGQSRESEQMRAGIRQHRGGLEAEFAERSGDSADDMTGGAMNSRLQPSGRS